MKLADWLNLPDANGDRRKRYRFAASIGVTPSMITDYCEGRSWPKREVMEKIVVVTDHAVMPNDFLPPELRKRPKRAA